MTESTVKKDTKRGGGEKGTISKREKIENMQAQPLQTRKGSRGGLKGVVVRRRAGGNQKALLGEII